MSMLIICFVYNLIPGVSIRRNQPLISVWVFWISNQCSSAVFIFTSYAMQVVNCCSPLNGHLIYCLFCVIDASFPQLALFVAILLGFCWLSSFYNLIAAFSLVLFLTSSLTCFCFEFQIDLWLEPSRKFSFV